MDSLELLAELIAIPGPPGEEQWVAEAVARHLDRMRLPYDVDAKGNVLVGNNVDPAVVVTAHLDEIALMVRAVYSDGTLAVAPLGGLLAGKIGEGPVLILADEAPLEGALSFGSVHSTIRPETTWDGARIITGRPAHQLLDMGVRPGTRVTIHPSRRTLQPIGDLVAGHFLDDRADLVAWLLALEELKQEPMSFLFAATTSEEVGGEGALYLMNRVQPDVCIALELGPNAPDSPVEISVNPTVWVKDSYASMSAEDGRLLTRVGHDLDLALQFQMLSSGGSDASCAAS
ncbi:MAG: hypothetical protein ACOYON_15635, partial [Fimbriimonas sp.]